MSEITLNFGAIEESILRLRSRVFDDGRNGVESFQGIVNENHILKRQQLIFHSICTDKCFVKQRLAERFIYQTIELINGVNWKDLTDANRTLRISFLDDTHVGSTTNRDELFNAIHTLIECKCRGFGNFDQEQEQLATDTIIENIMNNENDTIEGSDEPEPSWEIVTKIALSNFEKRYSHLSESEMKLVEMLVAEQDKKENYLLDLIQENKEKISKKKLTSRDTSILSTLDTYQQKLDRIDPKTIDLDEAIIACHDLREKLDW